MGELMNINQTITRWELGIQAGSIHASIREHFKDVEGGHECKLCGHVAPHVRGAQIHIAVHHKDKLEHAGNVTVTAGGPGSGRHRSVGESSKNIHKVAKAAGYGSPRGKDTGTGTYAGHQVTYTHPERKTTLTVGYGPSERDNFYSIKDQKGNVLDSDYSSNHKDIADGIKQAHQELDYNPD